MAAVSEIEIKLPDLSRVALEPGDKLLVRCPKQLSMYEADVISKRLRVYFPGHSVIIMDSGLELAVLRPVPAADAAD